jgi:hypothetical protein
MIRSEDQPIRAMRAGGTFIAPAAAHRQSNSALRRSAGRPDPSALVDTVRSKPRPDSPM